MIKLDEKLNKIVTENYYNVPKEVLNFRKDVDNAETTDDIERLIVSLSDGVAEEIIKNAFNFAVYNNDEVLSEPADVVLSNAKKAVLFALDNYLEENDWDGSKIVEEQQLDDANELMGLGYLEVDKSDFTDKAWADIYEAAKDGKEFIDIMLDDLKPETREYIVTELLDGDIQNFDIMPITVMDGEAILAMADDAIGVRTTESINFLEEYETTGDIPQWFIDAVEALDWSIRYEDNTTIELENYSPEGEDLVVYAEKEDLVGSLFNNYECFDEDEHIEMWIQARANGTRGVPSTRALVKDAEAINKMYKELAEAVADAYRAFTNGEIVTESASNETEERDLLLDIKRYLDVEIPEISKDTYELLESKTNLSVFTLDSVKACLAGAYSYISKAYRMLESKS
jgi:hypothetical protein